jgi:hypothetical protein
MAPLMEECFLCDPDDDLVYWSNPDNLALCGLGPIVKGYSVVATTKHTPSAADAIAGQSSSLLSFTSNVRTKLEDRFGTCLLAEHGRMPVCMDPSGTSDPHCYHAHFLLFPAAPAIEERAISYFASVRRAESLAEALTVARDLNEYFLLSPKADQFLIMTRPGRLIRQFVRLLVSESIGQPELADWRNHARREEAASMARQLRRLFDKGTQ